MTLNLSPTPYALGRTIELIQITTYERLKMFKVDVWHATHRHCDGYPADGTGLAESVDVALSDAIADLRKSRT